MDYHRKNNPNFDGRTEMLPGMAHPEFHLNSWPCSVVWWGVDVPPAGWSFQLPELQVLTFLIAAQYSNHQYRIHRIPVYMYV